MRLTSDFWVSAYLRRCNGQGGFAVVARRGEAGAGAIFIRVDLPDGTGRLYVPAPQTSYDAAKPDERCFVSRFGDAPVERDVLDTAIRRETGFDPDLWVIGVDDREGRHFLGDCLLA